MDTFNNIARNIRIKYPDMEHDMFISLLWAIVDAFEFDAVTAMITVTNMAQYADNV